MPQQQGLLCEALKVRGCHARDWARPTPQTPHAVRNSALRRYGYALPEAMQALCICESSTCVLALLLRYNPKQGSSLRAQATEVLDHEWNKCVSSCHHWQISVVLLL